MNAPNRSVVPAAGSSSSAASAASHGLQRRLTVAEVAALLSVSTRTIHRLVRGRQLQPIRVGRQLRFSLDEIRRFESGGAM
ncbi:MAG: helix-turn-helix domain-containing protein [Nitrospira sp.]|nr:helix-turn-helix domain-containing protein [Nitrospira sp.]